ncbi:MAG TPA: aminoglycoside phosphotransferase family protein [Bryobacteraceae bacterium]|nr:aminoglycoside phosphotransferase family protein [Bryobacteraceae bacterium]
MSTSAIRYGPIYDPEIPGSRLLLQPKQLAQVLSSLLASTSGDRTPCIHVHRCLPGKRCVASVDMTFVPAPGCDVPEIRRFVIKLYSAGTGAEVFETLKRLQTSGFSSGRFTVCRPLAYDPIWRLLLLERVSGESLGSRLLAENDSLQAAEDAARWLLALHNCGLTEGRRYDFHRHLHTLASQGRELAGMFRRLGRLYAGLLSTIESQARPLLHRSSAPTHRDFTPEHVIWNHDHLTGVDFDEFCQYDPLFDVGHFIAHLRLMSLKHSAPGLERAARRFQAVYQAGAEGYSAPRVRLYQAMSYLKLAYVVGVVERPRNWKDLVNALVGEAERITRESAM